MSQSFGITEYPNSFKRQSSFPIDSSTVFNSLDEATIYAESNPIAYEGQIVSVKNNGDVSVYVLKKHNDDTKNYKLSSLTSVTDNLNNAILDLNNLINSKIGVWSISNKPQSTDAFLDFDILYSLEATAYEVFYNEELVSNKLSLTDEFITNLEKFNKENINITIKFYNDDAESFEVKAEPVYKNKVVIFGSLHLTKLFD